jgi:hypothetical protein
MTRNEAISHPSIFSFVTVAENTRNVAQYLSHLVYVIVLRYFIGVGDPQKIAQIFADRFHSSDIEERGWKLSFLQNREMKRLTFSEKETLTDLARWFFSLKHAEKITWDPEKRQVLNQKAQELAQILKSKADIEAQQINQAIQNCETNIQNSHTGEQDAYDLMGLAQTQNREASLVAVKEVELLTERAQRAARAALNEAENSLRFITRTRDSLEGMKKDITGIDQAHENRQRLDETLAKVNSIAERVRTAIARLENLGATAKKWNEKSIKDFTEKSLQQEQEYKALWQKYTSLKHLVQAKDKIQTELG